jgi:hypothetical protein
LLHQIRRIDDIAMDTACEPHREATPHPKRGALHQPGRGLSMQNPTLNADTRENSHQVGAAGRYLDAAVALDLLRMADGRHSDEGHAEGIERRWPSASGSAEAAAVVGATSPAVH